MFPFPLIGGPVKLRPKPFPPRWISPQSSFFNHHLSRNFAGTDSGNKMEKITDKIAALPPDANYFSLEFFPPKTQMGFANLQARLERMAQALRPLFVTVTWGAGGTTAQRSLELAEICQRQLQLTTCLHLTCTNMSRALVDEALEEAKVLGIRNILALRGDPPRSEEYNMHGEDDSNRDFTFAVDLVRYIRQKYGDYFCLGVAAYPEGHPVDSFQDVQDPKTDLPYLVEKTQAGADFIMTQLTYDIEAYTKFENMLRNHESGAFKTIPIIPGLMPIHSYKILTRVTKLSHVQIPPQILSKLEEVKHDDDSVKRIGVDIITNLVDGMRDIPCPGLRGFHFYTLNLEKTVSFILERCDLIPPYSEDFDAIEDGGDISAMDGAQLRSLTRRRASSINSLPHNRVIVDKLQASEGSSKASVSHEAPATSAGMPAMPPDRSTTLQISEGLGALGREATWDDFPNGRWGDARSPAFGEIDGYGPSLHVPPSVAHRIWGFPVSREDISALFHRHVSGELHMVPWSEGGAEEGSSGLNAETEVIRPELLQLIDGNGWWTLASQPAVNGVRSDDPIYGWGPPREGFVFQKPFVEFFCPSKDYHSILKPLLQKHGHEKLAWFAANGKGDFESSLPAQTSDADPIEMNPNNVNTVTWGVFRGKEIVTPTIIEEVSFRAWGEEAFRIWDEWRRIYPRNSATERFLNETKDDVWLVCVVGQDFGAGTEMGSEEEEDEKKFMWRVLLNAK
ncbi:methylenetetrahydrofolate reductase-domain-containing protein [Aspergillus caelatus]|uniref:Methylenetetrahydrofolate reductase-domain-containing protein n=2 Tax=Aspergillus subgen. Circumdati TaxID=2720871 RepID=A0A5N7A2N6_9EURO|nr:methylenetetrahydrofolate reductase-domain-containing protein [Aspergillus caelatus]KAE8364144.1 methylenetetrahydrofolate reductase-domain-containing protein [Aspergillus caelatus]KAE8412157.1 methylenetetrahydrofolate reductase-domain-containing protein [Aspergillus pseudocaelatus]